VCPRSRAAMRYRSRMFQTDLGRAEAVLAALEVKRPEVAAHSRRVSAYSVRLAVQFGLADDTVETIRLGALLHDVGKMLTPASILEKPGRPNARMEGAQNPPRAGRGNLPPIRIRRRGGRHRLYHTSAATGAATRPARACGHPVHRANRRRDGHVRRADQLARVPRPTVRRGRPGAHREGAGSKYCPWVVSGLLALPVEMLQPGIGDALGVTRRPEGRVVRQSPASSTSDGQTPAPPPRVPVLNAPADPAA